MTLAAADGFRDALDGRQLAGAGGGKPGLDDIDTEARELLGDLQLLRAGQAHTGALLAVAKGCVKYRDPIRFFRADLPKILSHCHCSSPNE